MMKLYTAIILLLLTIRTYAQDKLEFVYQQKSAYVLTDEGVYADTLLLRFELPKVSFEKRTDPGNPQRIIGFATWDSISEEDKTRLSASVYHNNQTWYCRYHPKRDKTYIRIVRNDSEAKAAIAKYFKRGYAKFTSKLVVDYKERDVIDMVNEYTGFSSSINQPATILFFDGTQTSGSFKRKSRNYELTGLVELDPRLSPKIVPGQLFTNNRFGVSKIISLTHIITLKSSAVASGKK